VALFDLIGIGASLARIADAAEAYVNHVTGRAMGLKKASTPSEDGILYHDDELDFETELAESARKNLGRR
jgi:hypothetical protein